MSEAIGKAVSVIADRVREHADRLQTEEAVKMSVINPFLRDVLAYDTADPRQVVPEFVADFGTKQGEKVDYALLHDGKPQVFVEAKKITANLAVDKPSQLFRYFTAVKDARFGIYTNGATWHFYADIDQKGVMDTSPFLTLDLREYDDATLAEVAKFARPAFDPDGIRAVAGELKYVRALAGVLQQEYADPSDDFVRYLMGRVYPGVKSPARVEAFTAMTRKAFREFLTAQLRTRVDAVLATNAADEDAAAQDSKDEARRQASRERARAYYARKKAEREGASAGDPD